MNWILAGILLTSVLEVVVCHFSLWWILALVGRIMFSLRIVGALVKIKTCIIFEGVGIGLMLLWNMFFSKGDFPWFRIGMFILFSAICITLEYLDNMLYVYVIEEDDDYIYQIDKQNQHLENSAKPTKAKSTKSKKHATKVKTKKGRRR